MNILTMTCQLLLSLSLLVLIHEFGHYIAARAFGIRVTKFYIFFNPKFSIVRCKRINGKLRFKFFAKNLNDIEVDVDDNGNPILDSSGRQTYRNVDINSLPDDDWRKYPENTEYGIGWLPLGGFVKIAGMIDESLDMAQMKEEPKKWEFRSKPAWQRFIVMVAGVFMNVVAGVLIFTFSHLAFAKEYIPVDNVPEGIYAYKAARDQGFRSFDKIVAIDGKPAERLQDVFSANLYLADKVTVERNGILIDIEIPDSTYSFLKNNVKYIGLENYSFNVDDISSGLAADKAGLKKGAKILYINDNWITSFGQMREVLSENKNSDLKFVVEYNGNPDTLMIQVDSMGTIGISVNRPNYEYEKYNFASALKYGWRDAFGSVTANIKGFGLIFSGKEKASESLSGPIGIAQLYGSKWDWARFWLLTGLLSMVLAFVNILPIPALDGGHALFLFIEAITRRKFSDKFMEIVQIIGMLIIFALMIFIIGNDIIKLF